MEKNNSSLKVGLILFVIISVLLGGYIIYDKVLNDEKPATDNNTDDYYNDINFNILSIDKLTINENGVNTHLLLTGKMQMSFDKEKYDGANVEGYCLGENNETYAISGPGTGASFFYNGDVDLNLVEKIPSIVINDDNTVTLIGNTNWKTVKIKKCVIEKINLYKVIKDGAFAKTDIVVSKMINYEKSF